MGSLSMAGEGGHLILHFLGTPSPPSPATPGEPRIFTAHRRTGAVENPLFKFSGLGNYKERQVNTASEQNRYNFVHAVL